MVIKTEAVLQCMTLEEEDLRGFLCAVSFTSGKKKKKKRENKSDKTVIFKTKHKRNTECPKVSSSAAKLLSCKQCHLMVLSRLAGTSIHETDFSSILTLLQSTYLDMIRNINNTLIGRTLHCHNL